MNEGIGILRNKSQSMSIDEFTSPTKDTKNDEDLAEIYETRNFPHNENASLCASITDLSQIHNCNLTVYSFYPPELLWFGAICCIIFSIIGTTGNFVSIFALLKSKKLRNATTAFIINLCVSDLLFCSISMPQTAVTFIDRQWNGSDSMCRLFALMKFSNGIVSIFTVVAITVNRYVLIVHSKIYSSFYKKRNTALMIVFLWFLPLALLFLPFLDIWGTLKYDPEVGDCGVMDLHGKSPRTLIFMVAAIFPSLLFIACYVRIYFVVRGSVRKVSRVEEIAVNQCSCITNTVVQGNSWFRKNSCVCSKTAVYVHFRDKKEFRLLRIVLVLFVFFVFSTFPLAYVKIFHKEYDYPVMNVLGYVFYFSSNVINPIIYIVMSEEYRRAYKDLFCFDNFSEPPYG